MPRPRFQRPKKPAPRRRREESGGAPPPVGVADVVERDADGDLFVRQAKAEEGAPLFRLSPDRAEAKAGAPGLGDRLLVRFVALESGEVEARLIKRLGQSAHRILGVIRKSARETRVEPVDRRSKVSLLLIPTEARDLAEGDLVLAQVAGSAERRYGPRRGKVLERLGHEDDVRAASLIAIHAHGIPTDFSADAEAEAEAAEPPTLKGREDLRELPLITIDPADARDHDDAVFAEPDPDPKNKGGWIAWVAIADVAAYVRPGSALDAAAREKANSVYFPDRVEPMLPERLSAGLCSLREGEPRACLAVRMVFDAEGKKRSHRFLRGLMRSAAKLSYEEAQSAFDGRPDDRAQPIKAAILDPLFAAYRALAIARDKRSPLEITSNERRIAFGPAGDVAAITARASLPAHKLIEEFMVQANAAAAETLEQRRTQLIYRVHDTPSREKIDALAEFLSTIDIPWAKGQPVTTQRFDRLLDETRGGPHAEIVNEVVLRTQMQAIYSDENIGHFGLNLARYAHFTSPIRRYADLIVHRALIRALKLGEGALPNSVDIRSLGETAAKISAAERRAMAAERETVDRLIAHHLADRIGATFTGHIGGVVRSGLFVKLDETGADGFIPAATIGNEYFRYEERAHALVGVSSGETHRLGDPVTVRLVEAAPVAGALRFELISDGKAGAAGGAMRASHPARRGKPHKERRSRDDRSDRGDAPRRKPNKVRKRR
jgi:ribonuclease R